MRLFFKQVGSGGNSYFFHGTDLLEQEENDPTKVERVLERGERQITVSFTQVKEEGAYLYPNLAKAIVGSWKTKQSENYSTAEYRLGLKGAE